MAMGLLVVVVKVVMVMMMVNIIVNFMDIRFGDSGYKCGNDYGSTGDVDDCGEDGDGGERDEGIEMGLVVVVDGMMVSVGNDEDGEGS